MHFANDIEFYEYWNIVKGLGILLVVIGHTMSPWRDFIYTYHMSLFFFVSGILYKEKYSFDFFCFLSRRMKTLWLPYIKYGILYIFLHNLFIYIYI